MVLRDEIKGYHDAWGMLLGNLVAASNLPVDSKMIFQWFGLTFSVISFLLFLNIQYLDINSFSLLRNATNNYYLSNFRILPKRLSSANVKEKRKRLISLIHSQKETLTTVLQDVRRWCCGARRGQWFGYVQSGIRRRRCTTSCLS